MKRGQFFSTHLLIYVLIAIVSVSILLFGYTQLTNLQQTAQQYELRNFVVSLANTVEQRSSGPLGSFGSVSEQTFSLPSVVETVCFADRSKAIDRLVDPALNGELKNFPDANVFFEPFDRFIPQSVEAIEVDEQQNPLCVTNVAGNLKLSLVSKGGSVEIKSSLPLARKKACTSVLYNNEPEQGIDIVFLGYAYTSKEAFAKDASQYVNKVFASTEPFQSHFDTFSFYRVDHFTELGCEVKDWVACDQFLVKKFASLCPHDYIFVLIDRNAILNFFKPVRSSAISTIASINTVDDKYVLMHEFGHTFADFAEEYVDEKYYSRIGFKPANYPNCDNAGCLKWAGISGSGCFSGCTLGNFYRPTKTSIMRTLRSKDFGPVNEQEMISIIAKYEGTNE